MIFQAIHSSMSPDATYTTEIRVITLAHAMLRQVLSALDEICESPVHIIALQNNK